MKINIDTRAFRELDRSLLATAVKFSREFRQDAEDLAVNTVELAQDEIYLGAKTGRVYGSHQASAPGEAPANLTGELANSFVIDRSGSNGRVIRRKIMNTASYAALLEFGGFNSQNNYVDPRPFLQPAFEEAQSEFFANVSDFGGWA